MRLGGPRNVALGIVIALASLASCSVGTEKITDPSGGGIEPVDHEAHVIATNTGDGAGLVAVTFSAGTVTNGCQDLLGPGQTCTVHAEHTAVITSTSIVVQPGDLSIFAGFGGDCSGTASECKVFMMEKTVTIQVDVVFDLGVVRISFAPDPVALAVGSEGVLRATAFADTDGDRPVPEATFTWESSDAGVATVVGDVGGSATVTGIGAGEAWIRANARNGADSVKVVVSG